MFSLYRRHEDACSHQEKGIRYIKCSCPIWMDGYDDRGKRQRRSLKTRDWRHAQDKLNRLESGAATPRELDERSPIIDKAVSAYLEDCKLRKLAAGTITGYSIFLRQLTDHFPGTRVSAIDIAALDRFRAARLRVERHGKLRDVTSQTQIKELGYLRAFFAFALSRKWTPENPAKELGAPEEDRLPTLPFDNDEIAAILAACERIDNPNQREIPRARLRARALCLLLLYSGLRISDAVQLKRIAVKSDGRLLIRMMKTRAPLYLRLNPATLEALAALP